MMTGIDYLARAEAVLAEPFDRERYLAAYAELRAWHNRHHSRNRPPDLNCTNCRIWPAIERLAAPLGVDPLRPPLDMVDLAYTAAFGLNDGL